jgi:hypothetical protein
MARLVTIGALFARYRILRTPLARPEIAPDIKS